MEVWIETIDVEDVEGRVFTRIGSGTASIAYGGNPAGWRPPKTLGVGRLVRGAALPKRLCVRWQSLVEPQTYRATLDIPERARQWLLQRDQRPVTGEWLYRSYLILDLAPGGWVTVWVSGPTGVDSEALCVRAEVEPKGPSEGQTDGRYAYTMNQLEPATQQYLKGRAIPYGSWDCGLNASASN